FLPTLIVNFIVSPFLLRKPRRPWATGLVVMSNSYTFLQALVLLIRQRPLDWQASGATKAKRTVHFTHFKITALIGFMMVYALTFGTILLNDKFAFGPSMIIVGIFTAALSLHLGFMYYLLLAGIDKHKSKFLDRKFYAAAFMTVFFLTVVGLGYSYHSQY